MIRFAMGGRLANSQPLLPRLMGQKKYTHITCASFPDESMLALIAAYA